MKLRRSVDHQWECILSIQIALHQLKNELEDIREQLDKKNERENNEHL
jgi:hypothetical protein